MGQFGDALEEQAGNSVAGAANSLLGAGMGMLMAGWQDRRQLRQQQKLQDMQIAGQKEMSDYNYGKQLQMWHDTNYSAQVSEMNKAGINPALLYGSGGGGGTTIGSGSGGNVSAGDAPKGGGEIQQGMAMMLNNQMTQANIELIKSQTEKNKADTAFTAGAQTAVAGATVDQIKQGITNAKTINSINQYEEEIKKWDANIAAQTVGDRMGMVVSLAQQAASTAEIIERDNQIAEQTKQAKQ